MKSLYIFDTRQKSKVLFEPVDPELVKMYTCGPTVYRDAHIGNYRAYLFEDLLRRTLKYLGYKVIQVMNLTDVDDKTIRAARESKRSLSEITAPVIQRFFEDLDTLNIERAEYYPRATEHVSEMIELVQILLEKGYAYRQDNNIYYSIAKFPDYGKLSGMKLESLAKGVRIDQDEYEKEDFRDFALWKGWTPDDGAAGWDSPFGKGRPGWHIECSAMSRKYLGDEFDIHTGGVDNIFPHHENEIAQSVAATGKGFAKYWMHNEHLFTEGEKMSKSLGNVYTLRGLLADGHSSRSIRFTMLATHYRQRLNFTMKTLEAGKSSLERLDTVYQLALSAGGSGEIRSEINRIIDETRKEFRGELEDDLGIANSLAALFNCVSDIHRLHNQSPLNTQEGQKITGFWEEVDLVLGCLISKAATLSPEIVEKVRQRLIMRADKQFAQADTIRKELANLGYELEDSKELTTVVWAGGRESVKITSNNS